MDLQKGVHCCRCAAHCFWFRSRTRHAACFPWRAKFLCLSSDLHPSAWLSVRSLLLRLESRLGLLFFQAPLFVTLMYSEGPDWMHAPSWTVALPSRTPWLLPPHAVFQTSCLRFRIVPSPALFTLLHLSPTTVLVTQSTGSNIKLLCLREAKCKIIQVFSMAFSFFFPVFSV